MINPASLQTLFKCAAIAVSAATLLSCQNPVETTDVETTDRALGYKNRPIEDDTIYFVLTDRFSNGQPANDQGGIAGGPLQTGFDPAHKGFYHGGDVQGLHDKLDYLKELGVTAVWLAPIYKNKAVQYHPGGVSAGYHGYWITDFLDIDPHFGTQEELKAFINAAHDRGMKVIFDIVTNHTADVIKYKECHSITDPNGPISADAPKCAYRPLSHFPYVEPGSSDFPYTAFIPKAEQSLKNPAWLNNPDYYHNRGETDWEGESAQLGDFAGLDDLFTEHPQVLNGMIDIYKYWISEFKIDGFRIDTVKHVNDEFWLDFVPEIEAHARSEDIPNFAIFGEVYNTDPKALARFTHEAAFPAVLDFAFQEAARAFISKAEGPSALIELYKADAAYSSLSNNAFKLPTFLGNHDMGRIGHFLLEDEDGEVDRETLKRKSVLAHALMLFARGVPVIYYGDEQGFTGDGHDQDAREDMFPSKVASYNDNMLIGNDSNTSEDNFRTDTQMFKELQKLIQLRNKYQALRTGRFSVINLASANSFAFTRQDPQTEEKFLILLNASDDKAQERLEIPGTSNWTLIEGTADLKLEENTQRLIVEPYSYALLKSVQSSQ